MVGSNSEIAWNAGPFAAYAVFNVVFLTRWAVESLNNSELPVRNPMKTLFVLRHAKSSWSEPDLADFERPLNVRGLEAAPFMGELMGDNGFQPSVILSSPALRATQTAVLIKESGKLDAEIGFEHRIYEASPQGLRQVVSELNDSAASAMLVGHNPGIEGFIRFLTGNLEPMPTAALAVIELGIENWNATSDGCGQLKNVFRPKDEMKKAGVEER